jgi:hypothetical protein
MSETDRATPWIVRFGRPLPNSGADRDACQFDAQRKDPEPTKFTRVDRETTDDA